MKVRIINPSGQTWEFSSVESARPFVNKDRYDEYDIIVENGERIRVYDDREVPAEHRVV